MKWDSALMRHSWVLVAIVGLNEAVWALMGPVSEATRDASVYIATYGAGMGILTVAIAATAFRRAERWAWFAMWVWPVYFIMHGVLRGVWGPAGVFLGVSLLALLLSYRRVFPPAASGPSVSSTG